MYIVLLILGMVYVYSIDNPWNGKHNRITYLSRSDYIGDDDHSSLMERTDKVCTEGSDCEE